MGVLTPVKSTSCTALCNLVLRYCVVAYGGAWAVWAVAALLGGQGSSGVGGSVAGALLLAGTLMPMAATYLVFPRLCACGLATSPHPQAREGFVRFAFGMRPTVRGWLAFVVLLVWRWIMCNLAFGFPSIGDALLNVAASWPVLLLGGGLEEVGWRGCLQPALTRLCAARLGSARRGALVAPALTGIAWAFWHLPLFAIPGTFQSTVSVWAVVVVGIALSYSFGALHRITGNLDSCIASHAWYNAMLIATPVFGPVACSLFLIEAVGGAVVLARPWYSDVSYR